MAKLISRGHRIYNAGRVISLDPPWSNYGGVVLISFVFLLTKSQILWSPLPEWLCWGRFVVDETVEKAERLWASHYGLRVKQDLPEIQPDYRTMDWKIHWNPMILPYNFLRLPLVENWLCAGAKFDDNDQVSKNLWFNSGVKVVRKVSKVDMRLSKETSTRFPSLNNQRKKKKVCISQWNIWRCSGAQLLEQDGNVTNFGWGGRQDWGYGS